MEVLLPHILTSSGSSMAAIRQTPETLPPASPYSLAGASSSHSVGRYSATGSFSSLVPGTEEYQLEVERLQIEYRALQEDLHLEQERSRVQREQAERAAAFYERERTAREARHQQELAALRQQYGSGQGSSSKRRK